MPENSKEFPSELRFALISGDWVVIATGRAQRPATFKKEQRIIKTMPEKDCFFCNIETQLPPLLVSVKGKIENFSYKDEKRDVMIPKNWSLIVIPNKYPAFIRKDGLDIRKRGLHRLMNAYGMAEVVDVANVSEPRFVSLVVDGGDQEVTKKTGSDIIVMQESKTWNIEVFDAFVSE